LKKPAPNSILIIRPSALGDVCRTVPVLASLRAAYPSARIDWVVQQGFEDAIRAHPMLDDIILFPRKQFSGWWRQPNVARDVWRWARMLAAARYDLVLDCQGLGRSGLMAWATRSRLRAGLRSAREGAWLFYNRRYPACPSPHTVDEMLWLVACVGVPVVRDLRLYTHPGDETWWTGMRRERGIDGPYAVVAPTSRWASKRWPIERWCELLPALRAHGLHHVVVIGAPNEQSQVQELCQRPDVLDMVGASSVGQTMAMIRHAGLVIANDSAPLHMASGFDRPAIGLFGPTNPAKVGPYHLGNVGRRVVAIQPEPLDQGWRVNFRDESAGDAWMQKITVESVVGRIDDVLARREHAFTQNEPMVGIEQELKSTAVGTDSPQHPGCVPTPIRRRR